jgi:hypothetical protein
MYKPYKEEILEKHGTKEIYKVREFDEDLEDRELIWHRDEETRRVTVLSGVGWQLQLDEELPKDLIIGKHFSIPRLKYHRVIKGEGNLIVKIENI